MRATSRPRIAALAAVSVLATGIAPAAGAACPEGRVYSTSVTPPNIAIPGWPDRRALTTEIIDYFRTVDSESDRVATADFATSWNGTPLVYSLVTTRDNLEHVDDIAAAQQRLRDPRVIDPKIAGATAQSSPAIVWYTGNVHGNETSGADAAIEILYELAARTDCEVKAMLRNLVVGIVPTQNPDGRDSFSRTNAYGFDMNRDWFARTQPEIDGEVALLNKYPPLLFIDAHEMGSSNYFFPPNADPIYHEISPQAISWINDLYGPAMAAAFREHRQSDPLNWNYFNYDIYDLFYMGYGDTVPTTGFTAAGMTFEKGAIDTDRQREAEQFVAGWASLKAASDNKQDLLYDYYRAHQKALAEGERGKLEPNRIYAPGNELQLAVPDLRVRSYFIAKKRGYADVAKLIDRLLGMGVEVYKLKRDLKVDALQGYGRSPKERVVGKGTYWIPMDQPQKRWVQAMLHENTYVPFPYFYDVTAWSNPLLMNVRGHFTGEDVDPTAKRLRKAPRGRVRGPVGKALFFHFKGDSGAAVAAALELARAGLSVGRLSDATQTGGRRLKAGTFVVESAEGALGTLEEAVRGYRLRARASKGPIPDAPTFTQPKIALFSPAAGGESYNHMRFLFDQVWKIPYTKLTAAEVSAGMLTAGAYDVFVVPGVTTADLEPASTQIELWISSGGAYVGTSRPGGTGGTAYAVAHGYTSSSSSSPPGQQVPGTMFRVAVDRSSPVALGARRIAYWYNLGDDVLGPSSTGVNAALYPESKPDFFSSGYSAGDDGLKGTAALVDEKLGDGRVLLFSSEPNYRAYTEGPAFFLANALVYPEDAAVPAEDVSSAAARVAVAAARASAHPATGPGRPIVIEVAPSDAPAARSVLSRFAPDGLIEASARGSVFFSIPNPEGFDVEQHPFAFRLLPALEKAGVEPRSAVL